MKYASKRTNKSVYKTQKIFERTLYLQGMQLVVAKVQTEIGGVHAAMALSSKHTN